eukprot:CAMPEP_0197499862 /NCGR_PEP_ID=MMETSP1311-20131121/61235_1 /TAXON_ID=464262 /ORGANISM="Genus nov. species nov., Strain RCC856" /LENGTH=501 /DNA_ID=CAMNT_0043045609 /DNA_START=120 /DNA_END=1622 /DNA_ORIENTATION=-
MTASMAMTASRGALARRRGVAAESWRRVARGVKASATAASREVDVLVLGGGPVGSEVAITCAMLGKRVAVAEPRGLLLAAPTGWVSKALRQLGRDHGAPDGSVRVDWAMAEEYLSRTAKRALKLTANRFSDAALLAGDGYHAPEVIKGTARFTGAHTALVDSGEGQPHALQFANAFIAVGSASFRLDCLPWDDPAASGWLFDGDTIKDIGRVPQSLVVQGGGTIATEYAFIMRALGAKVTLVMREQKVMEGCRMDGSVQDAVMARMRRIGIEIRPESGDFSEVRPGPEGSVVLASTGEVLECDALLSATGRVGLVDAVDIPAAGCAAPARGGAAVDGATMRCIGQNTDHIYAVGDCTSEGSLVNPQGLLSTGLAESIIATHDAFPEEMEARVGQLATYVSECPVAVWVEPTVSYVGVTTEDAQAAYGDDGFGSVKVFYLETIKGCVERSEPYGRDEFLKLVYRVSDGPDNGRILGVHVYGSGASEFIHNAGTLVNQQATVW